jgi:hypothetical protein
MKELIGHKGEEKWYPKYAPHIILGTNISILDLPKDGIYETRFGRLLFKNGLWKLPDGSRDYFNFVDFNVDWYKTIN